MSETPEDYIVTLPISAVDADMAGMPAEWLARAIMAVGRPAGQAAYVPALAARSVPDGWVPSPEFSKKFRSYLGEGIHVAFRKGTDSRGALAIWKAIQDLPSDEWSAVVDFVAYSMLDAMPRWLLASAPSIASTEHAGAAEGGALDLIDMVIGIDKELESLSAKRFGQVGVIEAFGKELEGLHHRLHMLAVALRTVVRRATHPVTVAEEPGVFIDLPTLKWWRELVDLNPADLAPRLDDRIRASLAGRTK